MKRILDWLSITVNGGLKISEKIGFENYHLMDDIMISHIAQNLKEREK